MPSIRLVGVSVAVATGLWGSRRVEGFSLSRPTSSSRLDPVWRKHRDDTIHSITGKGVGKTALSVGDDGAGELVGALARLDRQWQIQRRNNPYDGGWRKLVVGEAPPAKPGLGDLFGAPPTPDGKPREEIVYLLEPEAPVSPSCVILFVGGAALGQFPHIAYSELLTRIARRINAAVIAAPFELGIDHFDLSKRSGEALRKAVILLEDEKGYLPALPKFMLAHSLGGKLGTISLAATGIGEDLQGVGFMSFNNFGVKNTITQSRSFAKELGIGGSAGGMSGSQQGAMLDSILDFAGMAVDLVGVEFSPSPSDTERLVSMRYDEDLQRKTRLFVFDDDDLDSSKSFVESCREGGGQGPSVSGLPGTHLTPVYLKFGIEDLDLPEEAKAVAGEFVGGFQSASFGSEENLGLTVNEICDWILGKPPSRGPAWGSKDSVTEDEGPRRLAGGAVDAEVEP
eukprot:CAMPEP_0183316104 /NCGR_PEP_ID=MMETSP0160_2-20130417/53879_1 /TAXON_ID=2839 ORGANISM="Odontella Sinensis, Strain Grunow 1884" /NCGR_SAMPLE_ID=MMETSP0160_2 /ASSEMBLY_ACC=CAM_ASM_000250 /LENGTH=454 /DNA_ID=CAMNT_0025481819 /DNA_START=92 /DNA_END=1456 /DNA_ORIENTATION=-